MNAVQACPPEAMAHILGNIVVVGGCALFAGMQTRLERELRALAPDDVQVSVIVPEKYVIIFF